jgi:hypothetical protein
VARVQRALEGLQGVSKVEFLSEPDRYIVDYDPAQVGYEDFARTFNHEVVGRLFRGMLDRLGGQESST